MHKAKSQADTAVHPALGISLLGVLGVGQQLLDAGHHAAQILQFRGDDDLGGLAVGHLGQCLQTADGQNLVGGHGLVQQTDGVGIGLLHGQDGLCLALGLQDALLLDGIGAEDGSFLFALGSGDGSLLFAVGFQDDGALFALGLHLLFHGFLDLTRGNDVLHFHPVDLDAPLVGGLVQNGRDLAVDDVTAGEGVVQLHLTDDVAQGGGGQALDGGNGLVDPEAAEVVKRIFAMTIEGYGPYQIASKLKEEKILIPSAYLAQHGEGVNKNKTFKDVYGWGSSTICNLLEKREYLGHTINFKTRKHFKDKKSHYVPEDEWTIFENTHEAIIDQQTFDLVQKIRGNVRRYPDGWGEAAPLTGLLYCADCGGKMYVHRTNNGKRISQYTCSQYSKVPVGKLCTTQHRINEDVVLSLVSEMLKAIAEYAKHDRAEFVRVVQEAQSSQQTAEVKKQRTRLATAKQRVSELEVLLCKIYEDNILGKLSDSRYATLDAQYEKEQTELTAEISVLEKAIKSYEKHEKDADRFIALIDKYENFDKLTIAMLNEFIEKILVHERDRKGSIQTTQEVEIYFNFVGRFVPPAFGEVELTPEELEEIRKREERKDRLHQNYLKRKANGKQKEYEERTKAKKKAEIEARKQAIRTEDIARGVFIPVSSLPQLGPRKGA